MELRKFIATTIREYLNEQVLTEDVSVFDIEKETDKALFVKIPYWLEATPLTVAEASNVHFLVEEMAKKYKMSKPRLFQIHSSSINFASFGISKKQYSIVLTTGALQRLNRNELLLLLYSQMKHLNHNAPTLTWLTNYLSLLEQVFYSGNKKNYLKWLEKSLIYFFSFLPILLLRNSYENNQLKRKLEQSLTVNTQTDPIKLSHHFTTNHLFLFTPLNPSFLRTLLFEPSYA
jgi:Zn-dependent protease with chaperone function